MTPGVGLGVPRAHSPSLRLPLTPSHQGRVFLSISHKHSLCHLTAFSFHSLATLLPAPPHP